MANIGDSLVALPLLFPMLTRAVPLALAGYGGIFSERVGIVNIGLEGMMLTGAFVGLWTAQSAGLAMGLVFAGLVGSLIGLIHLVLTQRFKMDHVVSGVAINILALHGTTFFMRSIFGPSTGRTPVLAAGIPGGLFIILTLVLGSVFHGLLFKTSFGLRLRSVGESPLAARMAGLHPPIIRLQGILISGTLAGLAGAYLSMSLTTRFSDNMVSGRGFIALAAVICGRWTPLGVLGSALVFGLLDALQIQLQGTVSIPGEVLHSLPYVFTILAAILLKSRPPAALGVDDGN